MGRISQEVVVALRGALHRKLQRLPMAYFDRQQTGRLMARVTSDVGSLLAFLNGGSLQLVTDLVLAAGDRGRCWSGSSGRSRWWPWSPCRSTPSTTGSSRGRIRELSAEIRAQVAAIYALLSERVSAVRVVRSFAKEEAELAALDERIDAHRALSWSNTRADACLGALATLISGLGTVFVVAFGAVLVGRGRMTVGELLAFYALVGQLYSPIVRLTQFQATAAATRVAVERIFEVLDEPEPIRDRPGARPVGRPRGAWSSAASASPTRPAARPVLDGIDLEVEPGTTLGVFGASGSGKSTLLALIPRLYDLAAGEGTILLDGQDVRDLQLSPTCAGPWPWCRSRRCSSRGRSARTCSTPRPDATEAQIRRALEAADLAAHGRRPAARPGHAGRRARPDALRRPAAAPGPGPGPRRRPGRPAARRLHQRPRRRDRGAGSARRWRASRPGGPA